MIERRLDRKTVLVVGAGGGIGTALVGRLVADGAAVVAADLRSVVDGNGFAPGAARSVAVDVRSPDDIAAMVEVATQVSGRLDGVVGNAGILGPSGRLHELDEAAWEETVDVNLTSAWRVLRAVLPVMVAQGGGAIVNTASVAGLGSSSLVGAYGASKAGVVSLTKTAAVEYAAAGIRVNAVCPGPVDTAMLRDLEQVRGEAGRPGKGEERIVRSVPMRRYATPEEVAAAVAFLLSDDAGYLTGVLMPVDGGMRAL